MAVYQDFRVKNGLAVSTTATIESTTQSLSTNTGALQVFGGAGIGGNVYVGGFTNVAGISTFTNTEVSVSTSTGALQVYGGAGIGGNVYVGGDLNVKGIINASVVGIISTATSVANGLPGQILYQQDVGLTNFIRAGTTGNVLVSYGTGSPVFQNTMTLAGTTNSTSTNSGAFQVIGGVGIGSNLWVGGIIYGKGSLTGLITTSTNISSGTAGQILYQSTSGVTGFVGPGIAGQLLMSSGTNAPLYVNTLSIVIGYALNANTSTNIVGGRFGSIPYQSNTGTTTMLILSTAGYFLLAGTNGPYWEDSANIFINTATNIAKGTTGQIPFQTGSGFTSFFGPGTVGQVLVSAGASTTGPVFQNTLTLAGTINATSTVSGAFQVIGGVGVGGNLYVGGDLGTTNTGTFNLINANATTINFAGSATSINIGSATGTTKINNNLTISGNLIVQGTSTIVDSTVTNITDPILTLGGLSNNQPLTGADNKDKGIAFKYFSGSAKTGFFGFDDSTGFFTFIPNATNSTEIISGTKGALDAYLAGGTSQSLVYQSSPNVTAFLAAGTGGNILQTNGTGLAPSWSNTLTLSGTESASSTNSGALQVVGGVGIGGNLYVGGITTITNTTPSISTSTGALTVAGGVGIRGDLYVGGTIYAIINGSVSTASNIAKGNTGQLLYQSGISTTAFAGTGTAGQILVSAGAVTTGPVFTNTSSIYVGYADKSNTAIAATNVAAGSSGQLLYQSSTSTTAFAGPGTAGQLLMSSGTNAPTYTNTASIYVGYADKSNTAITATNISSGTAGQILYQSTSGVTGFVGPGTSGQVLVSAGTTSTGPIFQNTLTLAGTTQSTSTNSGALVVAGGVGIGKDLYVGGIIYGIVNGSITTATNIANGSTGQLPIQSGVGKTAFISTGSNGNLLQYNFSSSTSTATWVSTASLYVGYSVTANNIANGTTGQILFQSATSSTAFVGTGTAGNVLVSAGTTSTGPIFQNTLTLAGTTQSTSTNSGALQVVGGVGIGGNLYVGGITTITNITSSISTSTGALTVAGGVGIGGNLYVGGITTITNITSSISTSTGALTVAGGVGIRGDLYVGGTIYAIINGSVSTASNIAKGNTGQLLYQSSIGTTAFAGTGTAGQILVSAGTTSTGPIFQNTLTLAGTTQSTSTNSGALQVVGGVGIGGNLYVGGITTITNITSSISTSTGALTVAGGVGIGGNLYVGGEIVAQKLTIQLTTVTTTFVQTDDIISTYNTSQSTSSISGALVVAGGVGIGKDLYVGGIIYGIVNGSITTATNIANGSTGQLPIQSGVGKTAFISTGSNGNLLQYNFSSSTSTATWVSTTSLYVGYSTSLAGGTLQSIHYQSSTGTTSFLAASTSGWILSTNGTGAAPTWINPSTLSPGGLTVQANVSAFEYVVGVGAAGSAQTAYIATTSSGQFGFNASTGFVGLGTTSPVSKLTVVETGGLASQIRIEGHENSGIAIVTPTYAQPGFVGYDGSGNIGIKQNNQTKGLYFSNYLGPNRIYITANGGISFNGTSNYGSQYQILQSNGDLPPTWISVGALTAVSSATQVNTVATTTNAVYYPTFVSANNSSPTAMAEYTTSSFTINPNTGFLGVNLSSNPNTGMSNIFGVGGSIVAGIAVSTAGTVLLQGKYGAGALTTFGTEYSSGGPVLGCYVYPSNAAAGAFLSSYASSISRGAYTIAGGTHNWYVGASQAIAVGSAVTMTNPMILNASGLQAISLGVGTAPSGTTGEIRATNEITAYYSSDARLKENITPIEDPIKMLEQIRGVYFDWTDEHIERRGGEDGYFVRKHDIGVIAQEVEAILPEIVATREDGFKAVKYEKMVPLLIETIKAQQRQIDQIQASLAKLVNK